MVLGSCPPEYGNPEQRFQGLGKRRSGPDHSSPTPESLASWYCCFSALHFDRIWSLRLSSVWNPGIDRSGSSSGSRWRCNWKCASARGV